MVSLALEVYMTMAGNPRLIYKIDWYVVLTLASTTEKANNPRPLQATDNELSQFQPPQFR